MSITKNITNFLTTTWEFLNKKDNVLILGFACGFIHNFTNSFLRQKCIDVTNATISPESVENAPHDNLLMATFEGLLVSGITGWATYFTPESLYGLISLLLIVNSNVSIYQIIKRKYCKPKMITNKNTVLTTNP